MNRVLTVKQMQDADRFTIEKLGIPSETLIERAGEAVYTEITKRYRGGRVLVCIGAGNNGKDGEIVAKKLANKHGFKVDICHVSQGDFTLFNNKYDIIVDCIFGTGLNREVVGNYKLAIEKINQSNAVIISCDIPSGLNGDTGLAMGIAVKADLTIAIQEYKVGHFLNDGKDYCGEIVVKDIGISIWDDDLVNILSSDDVKKYFPKRKSNSHKGSYGKVTIIGGSKDYSGSAMLSLNSLTALKMGVGYSTLYVPESLFSIYAGVYPECIIRTMPDQNGFILYDVNRLEETLTCPVIAIGMGIGVSKEVYEIIAYYLKNYNGTLIIDADGLNSLAKYDVSILKDKKCSVVLTPHIGEFSRLTGINKDEIMVNPIAKAKEFAKQYNVTLALKSNTTIITNGDITYLNVNGNTALAKAGSGDVLCGIMAGVLTRSSSIVEGVAVSCYVLGASAEFAVKDENEYVVTASDVIGSLGTAINSL